MKPFRPSPRIPSEAGFTLLEVLVVVIIVGVLASIAAPSWVRYISNQRVNAAKSDLVETLRRAQQDAIQNRSDVTISVHTPDNPTPSGEDQPAISLGELESGEFVANAGSPIFLGDRDVIKPGMLTLEIDPADETETLTFDYQGMVRGQELPYVIQIAGQNVNQQCVYISSLLGSIKTAKGDACDNVATLLADPD